MESGGFECSEPLLSSLVSYFWVVLVHVFVHVGEDEGLQILHAGLQVESLLPSSHLWPVQLWLVVS